MSNENFEDMETTFNKYNSIPFTAYFNKIGGSKISVDQLKRVLKIFDENGERIKTVHFSATIIDSIDESELMFQATNKEKKIYYVYENGYHGYDSLWYFEAVSLEGLL